MDPEGGGGRGPDPTCKITKKLGFLSNTGPDPLIRSPFVVPLCYLYFVCVCHTVFYCSLQPLGHLFEDG